MIRVNPKATALLKKYSNVVANSSEKLVNIINETKQSETTTEPLNGYSDVIQTDDG